MLGEQIIGNIDNDGYLRRDLKEIVFETNQLLAELNYQLENSFNEVSKEEEVIYSNPAKQFALDTEERDYINKLKNIAPSPQVNQDPDTINDEIVEDNELDENESNQVIEFEPFEEVTVLDA